MEKRGTQTRSPALSSAAGCVSSGPPVYSGIGPLPPLSLVCDIFISRLVCASFSTHLVCGTVYHVFWFVLPLARILVCGTVYHVGL